MAQKTILVDDLDSTQISDGAGETVVFSLDGTTYEIDLTTTHAAEFRDTLAPFIQAGRRTSPSPVRTSVKRRSSGPDLADVRRWAGENGHTVADRGRVPASVMQAYLDANGR